MSTHPTPPSWTARLDKDDLAGDNMPADPLLLFEHWFAAARSADMIEPTGATLAASDAHGRVGARTVLVKSFDAQGFYFYGHYHSRKGQDLADNPQAALLFWWDVLERQVRIEGRVHKLSAAQSDQYFAQRPRGSQISAHASPQSHNVASRDALEAGVSAAEERFSNQSVPRPESWGGYCLVPDTIEFWQGRRNRLHDRIRYQLTDEQWCIERLGP